MRLPVVSKEQAIESIARTVNHPDITPNSFAIQRIGDALTYLAGEIERINHRITIIQESIENLS